MEEEPSHSPSQTSDAPAPEGTGLEPAGEPPDLEPMTAPLLGRLFAVPLLIIATIVGGAIAVVLLFGGPASPDHRTIEDLLQVLEANRGEKSLGLLLPREKEVWQTALELGLRLEQKEKEPELTDEALDAVAERLSVMIRSELAKIDHLTAADPEAQAQQEEVRSRRLEFLIRALGRTERPAAVETLIEIVRRREEPYVQVAMQMLGDLHAMPTARRAVSPIVELLRTSRTVETRLVACTALSVLATGDDGAVIDALASTRLSAEDEVAWSAALALARLGSDAGKSTFADLLDRSFLETGERYRVIDEHGIVRRYPLPPQRVDALMMAAIDAASHLSDDDLWAMIEELQSDRSLAVRTRAGQAIQSRKPDGV